MAASPSSSPSGAAGKNLSASLSTSFLSASASTIPADSPSSRSRPGSPGTASDGARGCIAVRNLGKHATRQEVHVLFSSCKGYVQSYFLPANDRFLPCAIVVFDTEEQAKAAAESRSGSTWRKGEAPVEMVLQHIDVAKALGEEEDIWAKENSTPRRSRSSTFLGRNSSIFSFAKPRDGLFDGPPWCVPERVKNAHHRVVQAIDSHRVDDLEFAIGKGEKQFVNSHEHYKEIGDLDHAKEILEARRRRMVSRRAASAIEQLESKLKEAISVFRSSTAPAERKMDVMGFAAQVSKETLRFDLGSEGGQQQHEKTVVRLLLRCRDAWKIFAKNRLDAARTAVDEGHESDQLDSLELEMAEAMKEYKTADQAIVTLGLDDACEVFLEVTEIPIEALDPTVDLQVHHLVRGGSMVNTKNFRLAVETLRACQQRQSIRDTLRGAIGDGGIRTLRGLVDMALERNMEAPLVARGQDKLKTMEDTSQGLWALFACALSLRNHSNMATMSLAVIRLKDAINFAKMNSILNEGLQEYDRLLTKMRLRRDLAVAQMRGDIQAMMQLKIDVEAFNDLELLADPVFDLVKEDLAAYHLMCEREEELREAMATKRRRTRVIQQLPPVIDAAEEAGVSKKLLEEARFQVAQCISHKELEVIVRERDMDKIQDAVDDAELKKVDEALIAEAKSLIYEEALLTEMDNAIERCDVDTLEEAIELWDKAEFDPLVKADAARVFQEILAKEIECKENLEQFLRREITFKQGTTELDAPGEEMVREVADMLQKFPDLAVEIHGHSTNEAREASIQTSLGRAERVQERLEELGVDNRMMTKGWASHPQVRRKSVRIFPRWGPGRTYFKENPMSPLLRGEVPTLGRGVSFGDDDGKKLRYTQARTGKSRGFKTVYKADGTRATIGTMKSRQSMGARATTRGTGRGTMKNGFRRQGTADNEPEEPPPKPTLASLLPPPPKTATLKDEEEDEDGNGEGKTTPESAGDGAEGGGKEKEKDGGGGKRKESRGGDGGDESGDKTPGDSKGENQNDLTALLGRHGSTGSQAQLNQTMRLKESPELPSRSSLLAPSGSQLTLSSLPSDPFAVAERARASVAAAEKLLLKGSGPTSPGGPQKGGKVPVGKPQQSVQKAVRRA